MSSMLPKKWSITSLESVVDILDSVRIPINNMERQTRTAGKPESELFPYYGATGEVGKIDGYLFDEELIALGEDGVPFLDASKSKAYLISGKSWVNNHAHVLRANGISTNKFLLYFLNQFNYQNHVNGGTRLKLTQQNMRRIPVILPPLPEQKVIAEKLDSLLAQVESTKARLEGIPGILKQFRQSVLAVAVSGELTEDWRANSNYLISDWEDGVLGDFVHKPSYGSSAKSEKEGKIPVLRMGNIQNGRLDWSDLVFTSNKEEIAKYLLKKGDVLFNRTNSPELVGKTAIYQGERPAIYAGYLIKVQCKIGLVPEYLNYHLNSPSAKAYCYAVKSDGVSQSNINAQKLMTYPLNKPCVEEQEEIVRRVEGLFGFADKVEAQVKTAMESVNHLTQSILAQAFSGELTKDWREQNPDLISGENSAAALLERIKAERERLKAGKKG